MCGRFVLYAQPKLLDERLAAPPGEPPTWDFAPAYNITPGYLTPVVIRQTSDQIVIMKWGLIPFWAKDPRIGYKTINARAEGIADKPTFRKPIRSQRCLVLSNGFYEWQKSGSGSKTVKVPHFIHLPGRESFAFAGIYDVWRDTEGRETRSYAIITTTPNDLMTTIHNRMPVILPADAESSWLDPTTPFPQVLDLLHAYPADEMEAYPVAELVNNPHNDDPALIARRVPVTSPQLPLA